MSSLVRVNIDLVLMHWLVIVIEKMIPNWHDRSRRIT